MEKVLSIIIPVYNVEKYIYECLDSIIYQKNCINDCEIILVNDGSTDSSGDICKKYAKKYKNIKYLSKKNGGLSDARNFGIENASGNYIWFIDSDDYIQKDCISKIVKAIKEKKTDVIVCQSKIVDDNNNKLEPYWTGNNYV